MIRVLLVILANFDFGDDCLLVHFGGQKLIDQDRAAHFFAQLLDAAALFEFQVSLELGVAGELLLEGPHPGLQLGRGDRQFAALRFLVDELVKDDLAHGPVADVLLHRLGEAATVLPCVGKVIDHLPHQVLLGQDRAVHLCHRLTERDGRYWGRRRSLWLARVRGRQLGRGRNGSAGNQEQSADLESEKLHEQQNLSEDVELYGKLGRASALLMWFHYYSSYCLLRESDL